jgi:hypothetical protein
MPVIGNSWWRAFFISNSRSWEMDKEQTLIGTEQGTADSSPAQSYPRDPVSTIRGTAAREASNPGDSKEKAQEKGTEAEETKTGVKAEVKETKAEEKTTTETEKTVETEEELLNRIDKNPGLKKRFDALNKQAKDFEDKFLRSDRSVKELSQRLEEMGKHLTSLTATKKDQELTDEDLAEMFEEDPGKAAKKLLELAESRAYQRLIGELNENNSLNERRRHLEEFSKQFTDFNDLWEKGELASFVDQNPLHNPISAYLLMSLKGLGEKHKSEVDALKADYDNAIVAFVDAARKEEQEKGKKALEDAKKNFQAKKDIKIIEDTPSSASKENSDSEIRTAKGHTLLSKIAENLGKRRAAA